MTINDFKEYVRTRNVLNTEEIRCVMGEVGNEVRDLLSELFCYRVPLSVQERL